MRHAPLSALLLVLGLLCLAAPAVAAEWVEGDGFRFRVPDGFVPADAAQLEDGVFTFSASDGQLFGGSGIDMEMRAYVRDRGSSMEAGLGLVRMSLEGDAAEQMEEMFDLDNMVTMMQQGMEQAAAQYGAGIDIGETQKIMLGAGQAAVEWRISADDPAKGPQVARIAFTKYEESLYVLMFAGPEATARQDEALWRGFTTSVRLSSRGGLLALAKKHWPFLVGGFVILFGLFLLARTSASRRNVTWLEPSMRAGSGGGFSRALDGLPLYDEQAGGARGPAQPSRPSLATTPVGGPRRIPVSRSAETGPGGLGDPLPSQMLAPKPPAQPPASAMPAPAPVASPSTVESSSVPAEPSALGALSSLGSLGADASSGEPKMPTNVAERGGQVARPAADAAPKTPEDPEDELEGPRIQRNADFMK